MTLSANSSMSNKPVDANASEQEISLIGLLIILSVRRKFILIFTAAITVLACVVSLLLPNKYTAITVVMPPSQSSSSSALLSQLSSSSMGGLAALAGGGLGLKSTGDTYVSLFHSRTVEDSLIQRFGLMERYHCKKMSLAQKALEGRSKISYGAKDGLISISVTDIDAKMAAAIANGWTEEFHKLSANLAITEAAQRRLFYQQQLREALNNLSTAEENLKNTQQSTGVLQIDSQTRYLVEAAANLRAQIVAKEVQLHSLSTYATEDNPETLRLHQEISELQTQLGKLSGAGSDTGLLVPKGKIPEAGLEYVRKVRDVKYYETIYELLAKQFEMAKLDEAREGSELQVVDAATPPDRKSAPKRMFIILGAFVFALLVSCVICFLDEIWRRMKSNPEEMERWDALRASFRQ